MQTPLRLRRAETPAASGYAVSVTGHGHGHFSASLASSPFHSRLPGSRPCTWRDTPRAAQHAAAAAHPRARGVRIGHRGHAQSAFFLQHHLRFITAVSRSACVPGAAPSAVRRWQARRRCAKCAVDGGHSETSELASSECRLGLPGHAPARHQTGAHPRDAVRVAPTPRRACAGCWGLGAQA